MDRSRRWSDEDKYWGPFTYAPDKYKNTAIVLNLGDEDYPGDQLRFSLFGHTFIVALPSIARMDERQYGFSHSEGYLQVFFGRRSDDSSKEQRWSCFIPWSNWRHVRYSLYGLNGRHYATQPKYKKPQTIEQGNTDYCRWKAIEDSCPTQSFSFKDFDGQELTAKTKIEEREWRLGEGYFKWLSFFRKPKIRRSLDIQFSGETGKKKGSWKGGTVGHSIEMSPGYLHATAFRDYCKQHEMTFLGYAKESPEVVEKIG